MGLGLRIAAVGDSHISYRTGNAVDPLSNRNQRSVDFENAFRLCVDDILALNPDLFIHTGDVFDRPKPGYDSVTFFLGQMRRIVAAGIPVVVVSGNHDQARLRTASNVFTVLQEALPSAHFVCGYAEKVIEFGSLDLTVHAVPYGRLDMGEIVLRQRDGFNVLAVHGKVAGATSAHGVQFGSEDIPPEILHGWFDAIVLGHCHRFQRSGPNAYYTGPVERCGFSDEAAVPGYMVVDLEAWCEPLVTHVPIAVRPMLTMERVEVGPNMTARAVADSVLASVGDLRLPDANVRIEIAGAERPFFREVQALVKRDARGLVWSLDVFQRTAKRAADEMRTVKRQADGVEVGSLNILSLFSEFLARPDAKYPRGFGDRFGERGRAALVTVGESYVPDSESA